MIRRRHDDLRDLRERKSLIATRTELLAMIDSPGMRYLARDDWGVRLWTWAARKWLAFNARVNRA